MRGRKRKFTKEQEMKIKFLIDEGYTLDAINEKMNLEKDITRHDKYRIKHAL